MSNKLIVHELDTGRFISEEEFLQGIPEGPLTKTYELEIGKEITADYAKELLRLADGSNIYMMSTRIEGERKSVWIKKEIWLEMKAKFEEQDKRTENYLDDIYSMIDTANEPKNYLSNSSYFGLVETFANISESKDILYVYLETELSLITGGCGVKCETDPNYIGALEQAITLLNDCESLDQFKQKLIQLKARLDASFS